MLKSSFRDLLPIIIVISFFQFAILQQIPDNLTQVVLGLSIVAVGLAVFLQGLETGIFPVGGNLANAFARKGSIFWLLLFAFLIGFSAAFAEPALMAIAGKAEEISGGRLDALVLRFVVSLSAGLAIMVGVFRILAGWPIHWFIITGYILVLVLTWFTPEEIVGLAYDSGGVTTSTITVPLVAALGIGLASSVRGRNPLSDGFGLIAFAALAPMIFVQLYGIVVYEFFSTDVASVAMNTHEVAETVEQDVPIAERFGIYTLLMGLIGVIKDVAPILLVIAFFQYMIIKKQIPHLKRILIGIVYVIIGLYAFIVGLELGLFELGESMAFQLTETGNVTLICLFGFLIGFSTTMAEPALIAVALKAREVSQNKTNDVYLRIFVAMGVAVGVALGCYRIVVGDSIHYYVIVGYATVIILTFLAPKYIIPIAYDSGGVTTSTVTVPLVAALGLGLATNIPGRSPLIDGFGLIAFASLFPIITVMTYGMVIEYFAKIKSKEKA